MRHNSKLPAMLRSVIEEEEESSDDELSEEELDEYFEAIKVCSPGEENVPWKRLKKAVRRRNQPDEHFLPIALRGSLSMSNRWEGPSDLFHRVLNQHRQLLDDTFAAHANYQMLVFPNEDAALTLLSIMAFPENGTYASTTERKGFEAMRREMSDVVSIAPHGFTIGVDVSQETRDEKKIRYTLQSRESPIVIEGRGVKFVMLQARTDFPDGDSRTFRLVVMPKATSLAKLYALLTSVAELARKLQRESRVIEVYSAAPIPLPETSWSTWDSVFLSDENVAKLKDDLYFFLNNEQFFRDEGLPWKRGYLLVGPPGNGKTSVCRTVATSMPFASFMFDFSNRQLHNNSLSEAFKDAVDAAPSVFFLEDIDRVYDPDNAKESSNITLDHLLNCLDGMMVNDGLVVIATANNHKSLDPAILARPGRFDAVVLVDNPDAALRQRYLKHLFRRHPLTESQLGWLVAETKGTSMAYLKEIFLSTMKRSMIPQTKKIELTTPRIEEAVEEILSMYRRNKQASGKGAGFTQDD